MMISKDDAVMIWPELSDEEIKMNLNAIETMIRNKTHNNFQDRRVRLQGVFEFVNNKIYGSFYDALFRKGDRIEVSNTILNEGLYNIIDITKDHIVVDGDLEAFKSSGIITKVVYPDDILKAIHSLADYDKIKKEKMGIKSETISRYSATYFDINTVHNEEGYPAALLDFIKKYRKLRWS